MDMTASERERLDELLKFLGDNEIEKDSRALIQFLLDLKDTDVAGEALERALPIRD